MKNGWASTSKKNLIFIETFYIYNPDLFLYRSNRRVLMNPSNIEQWILLVREVTDVQRLEWAPSLIPELIANFEEHPNPDDCVGVDYKAIYLYISTLMDVS